MGSAVSSLFEDRSQQQDPKSATRKAKVQHALEKKRIAEEFANELLDDSFLNLPVRDSTVHAAKLYPTLSATKTLMPGSHKHLGGAYDPLTGCIYGVPANSKAILCLTPVYDNNDSCTGYDMTSISLPESVAGLRMKWLRGIVVNDPDRDIRQLWAIPSGASAVLCVDLDKASRQTTLEQDAGSCVELVPLPDEYVKSTASRRAHSSATTATPWQWHGAGINHEKTAIYCIPSNAKSVLKVDILAKTTSLIDIEYNPDDYPNYNVDLPNKWYGGIVGADNCVYGINYRSCALLQIDCDFDKARLVGPDHGNSQFYWHGGINVDGKIYAHPSHADTVLVIDTNQSSKQDSHTGPPAVYELPIKPLPPLDKKTYKWLGGAVGADGNIYCPACDTTAVLKIDVETEKCTTFGFAGRDKNKWQGGLLGRDGCVYCIPANGRHILRIHTNNQDSSAVEQPVQLVGDLPEHKDKWQGGSEGKDGSLYFIPENGYRVLKVTPPPHPPKLVNGQLPEGDVHWEFL